MRDPWGSSTQRRGGLPPILTNSSSTHSNPSNSPSRTTFSPSSTSNHPQPPPGIANLASYASSARQNVSRNSSVSSTSSPFSPSTGNQQRSGTLPQTVLNSSRGRNIPPSSHSQFPAPTTGVGGATSGGSGSSGPRLSRASPSLSLSSDVGSPLAPSATSAPFSTTSGGGSASIDIAQVSIQLARLDKEKDPQKLEESIRSLNAFVSHSTDVLMYTMRKLIRQHAARIFGNDTSPDPQGSFTVLANEIEDIRVKPEQARKIAEAIDVNEGEPFRDFDLSTFMEKFKLDPVAKCMLALSLKTASKADLKTKADAILSNNLQHMYMTILNPTSETGDDLPSPYLAALIDRLLQNPPRNWSEELQSNLNFSVRARYDKLGRPTPNEVMSTLQLPELTAPPNELVKLVQRTGERATSSLESCKEMLQSAETRHINYTQVASVLLYMVITQGGEAYDPAIFVQALREHRAGRRLDWQDVVHSFDREGLVVSKQQFLALYHALLPLAQEYENFDIQLLWGGQWQHIDTQLPFVVAFLSCNSDELNADEIPRLRRAYQIEDFEDASPEVKEYAAQAVRHPLVSLDATAALFKMIFQNSDTYKHAISLGIPEAVINPHTPYFVVASAAVPQPWGGLQDQAFDQLFVPFLRKQLEGYSFVFHGLWKHDSRWFVERLMKYHVQDSLLIGDIYEHTAEHGWLEMFTSMPNEFGLDLATYAHGHGEFDIENWLNEMHMSAGAGFPPALSAFIEDKARNEVIMHKLDPAQAAAQVQTPPLTIDTAYTLLTWLSQVLPDDLLEQLNRIAISAYPRLINYGDVTVDAIIRENSQRGNAIHSEADEAMQDHFKQLYNRDIDVKTMVEHLQKFKGSEDPGEQELFACMIQGLFDEYSCFGEYPPDALATTAVLFGSIINFNLLSTIALQAGLHMVYEALQQATSRDDKMYKFGLQALIQFQSRLAEWPTFCEKLLGVPELQGTEMYRIADDIVRSRMGADLNGDAPNGVSNGVIEDLAIRESSDPFTSLSVDPILRPEIYQEPDEEIQDRVIFAVNNLSDRNIDEKFKDIQEAVTDQYHKWFANHLVEDRAKSQPNYHELFLKLLRLFDSNWLYKEVIRETIATCVRLLNADTTMNSPSDRNQLKNLGAWLGSLTLARDKPILHRNIAFPELLVEAHKSKRLLMVIPFVCRILKTVAQSKTFGLPNPWTAELLSILAEFYYHIEMKIQLKFEFEVLCKDINVDMKKIEPSVLIRESDFPFETDFSASVPDGLEGFHELTLANFSGRAPGMQDRFSAQAIINSLPDISGRLVYPPMTSTNQVTAEQTRSILQQAADHAIREIIFPVVERSVTIAGISASQLVKKDFATEPEEERFRNAAHSMVTSLAGSLALVTCREPLRMSMSNNVRAYSRSLPGDGLPEGVIIMFVNDNIDIVCKVVEEAAEKQSIQVIDEAIQEGIQARAMYRQQGGDESFQFPQVHRYARMMPDPFKPNDGPGGLSSQQLSIYENFGPSRPALGHAAGPLRDGQQQLDQLPAFDTGVPNIGTPSGEPAVPRHGQLSRGPEVPDGGRVNGYGGSLEDILSDVLEAARNSPDVPIAELPADGPVKEAYARFLRFLQDGISPHAIDRTVELAASQLVQLVLYKLDRRIEIDLAAELLATLCQLSGLAGHRVWQYLSSVSDENFMMNPSVMVALLSKQLIARARVDSMLASAFRQHIPGALTCFVDLMNSIMGSDKPSAFRGDFATSFEALSQWVAEDLSNEAGREILERLHEQAPASGGLALGPDAKKDQLEHVFEEWIQLYRNGAPERSSLAFMHQINKHGYLKDPESTDDLLRACLGYSVQAYEEEEVSGGQLAEAYMPVDALARLIVLLVTYQGESEGAVKPTRPKYLDSLLALLVLIQGKHFRDLGERANQKVYFRLYSNMLWGFHENAHMFNGDFEEIIYSFGTFFLMLQPRWCPGFTFSWLALISHRFFVGPILKVGTQIKGWDMYTDLLEIALKYADFLLPTMGDPQGQAGYILAIIRILLLLHHDFPEYVIENHARLAVATPAKNAQMINLINNVAPPTVEIPDPFAQGLRIDHVEDLRRSPTIRLDLESILEKAEIKTAVDAFLSGKSSDASELVDMLASPEDNGALLQAVVLYAGAEAIAEAGAKSQLFNKSTNSFALLNALALELAPSAKYFLINGIVNQLRYPNAHTVYFAQTLLEMFGPPSGSTKHAQLQEQIAVVLLERLMPQRPHPWGLLAVFMELVKNKEYEFQGLPFVRENEEVWSRPRALEPLNMGIQANLSGF